MSVFREYAEYYDLLYQEKDYDAEAGFVRQRLGELRSGAELLEFGSGTGRHAEALAKSGIKVTGVDLSPEMVEQARRRSSQMQGNAVRPDFAVGDLRTAALGRKFDVVISLFHVFSYQTSNADLAAAFANVASHLAPRGRFFFDFWYGPAVLSDPPQVRVRRIRGTDFTVTRIAEPNLRQADNCVDVNYELIFERDSGGTPARVRERHPMRYLFLPEIEDHLGRAGLRLTGSGAWMRESPLGLDSWYGWVSAEAVP